MSKRVEVAAAVITRPDGSFLLGQRAPGTFYPGYWEFPGGKVEPGETPRDALARELREELGIEVTCAWPWLTREHCYEHAHVRLHFFEVPAWSGTVNDHIHAALSWQRADTLTVGPMLPANGPILKALRLPRRMGITQAGQIGVEAQLARLEQAIRQGLGMIQIREPGMPEDLLDAFVKQVLTLTRPYGTLVVINGANPGQIRADGLHLTAAQLAATSERPPFEWVGASCHTRTELERAATLGLDYALLGPIKPTPTHPEQPGIGWAAFTELTNGLPLPVFALGGLSAKDLEDSRIHGAHGVAGIRGFWEAPRA